MNRAVTIGAVVVGVGSISALIYSAVKRKADQKIIDCIYEAVGLDEPTGQFGDLRDYAGNYLSPTYFSDKAVASAAKAKHPNDWEKYKDDSLARASLGHVMINKAFASWIKGGDNESQIYAAFKQLKSRWEVSVMAWTYNKKYGSDLLSDLEDKLDSDELAKVQEIIKSKPIFI